MRFIRTSILALAVAGCWQRTVRTSEMPATPTLRCLDCEEPVAVGMPIRFATSWAGSCTDETTVWQLHEEKDTEEIKWSRSERSSTRMCKRKAHKLEVTCSAKCIVHTTEAPDPTSEQKVIAVFPEHAGPLRVEIKMRAAGAAPTSEPAAQIEASFVVRVPDLVGDPVERRYEAPSPRAAFAGRDYDLIPTTRHPTRLPSRGERYRGQLHEDAGFDRLERSCFTRAPGAPTWRICSTGVRPGDDVRIDIAPTLEGQPILNDVKLTAEPGPDEWHCYRTPLQPIGQTCTRYAIPAGAHALLWTAGPSKEANQLLVAAPTDALGLDPASLAPPAHADAVAVSFDAREAFDTRGVRGFAVLGVETELIRWNAKTYPAVSVLAEVPIRPRWGALRLGFGGLDSSEGEKTFRIITGWRYSIGCLAYRLCLNVAADAGVSFADAAEGAFVLPHANLDLRGARLVARIGAGPALLLGPDSEVGLVVKLTVGFGGSY